MLLTCLALETLVLVMDGSGVGRGCGALMIHVIYKGRALPLAWVVRQCPKGHAPEALHIELVELVRELIPEGSKVVFLGDGEFDGTELQATLNEAGWFYACRTSKSTVATWEGLKFNLDLLGSSIKPGMLIELKEVQFTRNAYGPVMVRCCWAKDEAEPLYLERVAELRWKSSSPPHLSSSSVSPLYAAFASFVAAIPQRVSATKSRPGKGTGYPVPSPQIRT